MHILFLDESGTPPGPDRKKHRYFVIGGIIIPEGQWFKLANALHGLKVRKRLRGELKWRYFAPGNVKPENPMNSMNEEERNAVREELYRIICSERSVKTMACVTCIEAAYERPSIVNRDDIYKYTYKPVSERFQYHLQDLSREVGRPEYGIIVCDHRGSTDDARLRLEHESLIRSSRDFTSRYKNLIECLFLSPSHLSAGIQLADMVAGAVWRKYEAGDGRWFKMLEPSLRRSKKGEYEGYGIVKFPTATWK